MADFDQIDRRYASRVEGSDVQQRPIDALLNADAHAFTTRVNSTQILEEMKKLSAQNESLNARLEALVTKLGKEV